MKALEEVELYASRCLRAVETTSPVGFGCGQATLRADCAVPRSRWRSRWRRGAARYGRAGDERAAPHRSRDQKAAKTAVIRLSDLNNSSAWQAAHTRRKTPRRLPAAAHSDLAHLVITGDASSEFSDVPARWL